MLSLRGRQKPMTNAHTSLGMALVALAVVSVGAKYFRTARKRPLPVWGWIGLAVIVASQLLLALRAPWVTTFLTPIVWTGYLLIVDGLVDSLEGDSQLRSKPAGFLALASCSVPLWLVFEVYNLRLANWTYIGLPESRGLRLLGYTWSFATIWPAIYETADLLRALGLAHHDREDCVRGTATSWLSQFALPIGGLWLLAVPVLLPPRTGRYLFGGVWLGFILLLDPLSYRLGGRSLLRDWETRRTGTLFSFMAAGLVCGVVWEFWNYWAGAKWVYLFPIGQHWKIFQMPLPGYMGFPPFGLECFVMYEFLRCLKNRLFGVQQAPEWEVARSR